METLLPSAVTLGVALALFVIVYRLVQHETNRGDRVCLRRVRAGMDWLFGAAGAVSSQAGTWLFAAMPRRQSNVNPNVATLLHHATRTPLTVTYTNNHLSQMHDHKSDTALTPAQKRKLSKKKLEERF